MYKEHPSFSPIPDTEKIWRFMDLSKFCFLLKTSSLFFIRPENFKDPWEGFMPRKHFDETSYGDALPPEIMARFISMERETLPKHARKEFGVNCWHISEYESEAFWSKYSGRGIAIQSTFGRLKGSFDNGTDYDVNIGKIVYKDHNLDVVNAGNFFNRILWKRKSFEYENELRAVIWEAADPNGEGARPFDHDKGQSVKVDLGVLIENIYTTPFEDDQWFNTVVEALIRHYGYDFPCKRSELMNEP